MMFSGGVLTLALALLAAQGPRARHAPARPTARAAHSPSVAAATKKKRTAPAPAAAEKQVVVPAHSDPAPARRDATAGGEGSDGSQTSDMAVGGAPTKSAKTKVYTFGAMDVEGKLKTPQLLYFLNRVKLELEMSAPDHRSFMKELQKTADDPAL